jgi:hypothetical protein
MGQIKAVRMGKEHTDKWRKEKREEGREERRRIFAMPNIGVKSELHLSTDIHKAKWKAMLGL